MVETGALDLIYKSAKAAYQGEWIAKIDPATLSLNLATNAQNMGEAMNNAIYITTMNPLITVALIEEIRRLQALYDAKQDETRHEVREADVH